MGSRRDVPLLLLLLLIALAPYASCAWEEQHIVILRVGERNEDDAMMSTATKGSGDGVAWLRDGGFGAELLHREAPGSPLRTRNATVKQLVLGRMRQDALRSRKISVEMRMAEEAAAGGGGAAMAMSMSATPASSSSGLGFLQAPLVSGMAGGSGDYFVRMGVGTPAREVLLVADTGSDVSWLQCAPCRRCYAQAGPIFEPAASSSFRRVRCGSAACGRLRTAQRACSPSPFFSAASDHHHRRRNSSDSGGCLYRLDYGDGSFTAGELATETLTFAGGAAVAGVPMGCGRDNQGLFHSAAGLLGLGRGPLSFPTEAGHRFGSVFSYCLPRRESSRASPLLFGHGAVPPSAALAPLLPNPPGLPTYLYAPLASIRVAGAALRLPPAALSRGGVIVDTGTAVTRLASPAYVALRAAFRSAISALSPSLRRIPGGVSLFDTCYDLSGRTSARLPAVDLAFDGGATMHLPADSIMVAVDDAATFCLAFAPQPDQDGFSIIGNVQQQTFRISIDLAKQHMGIAPHQC